LLYDVKGCTKGSHTDDAPQIEAPKSTSSANLTMTETPAGKEVYTSGPRANNTPTSTAAMVVAPAPPVIEAEDDLSISVKIGTMCQRKGCGVVFESDEKNRIGDGEGTVCTYHPAPVSLIRNDLKYHVLNHYSQYSGKVARCVH
jgi:hypothetical protein